MRLYCPVALLIVAAVWLAVFGDSQVFGVIVFCALAATVWIAERERARLRRRRRNNG